MLRFRDIDVDDAEDVDALVRWANDSAIRHLFLRFASEEQYRRPLEHDFARERLRQSLAEGRLLHLIEWHGQIVGEVSLDLEATQAPGFAWLGIVIGEESARGRGIGRKAMLHIEAMARARGATRAQIGVFEFNERARKLYRSLGYRELSSTPNITWWKGRQWTDIRMGKPLAPTPS